LFEIFYLKSNRDRLRTSINVLGDAYGCGIVEHLSRNELKKLDEQAEHEFAQIIAKQQEPDDLSGGICVVSGVAAGGASTAGTGLLTSCHPREIIMENETTTTNLKLSSNQKLPISSAAASAANQFGEYKSFERRPSNRSQLSISQNNQLDALTVVGPLASAAAVSSQQLHIQPPSIVVMDALRRRSRALLFASNKLPSSVNSMPQISNYAVVNPNNNNNATSHFTANVTTTSHGVNQDSNV
jgi:hypothetical protein